MQITMRSVGKDKEKGNKQEDNKGEWKEKGN